MSGGVACGLLNQGASRPRLRMQTVFLYLTILVAIYVIVSVFSFPGNEDPSELWEEDQASRRTIGQARRNFTLAGSSESLVHLLNPFSWTPRHNLPDAKLPFHCNPSTSYSLRSVNGTMYRVPRTCHVQNVCVLKQVVVKKTQAGETPIHSVKLVYFHDHDSHVPSEVLGPSITFKYGGDVSSMPSPDEVPRPRQSEGRVHILARFFEWNQGNLYHQFADAYMEVCQAFTDAAERAERGQQPFNPVVWSLHPPAYSTSRMNRTWSAFPLLFPVNITDTIQGPVRKASQPISRFMAWKSVVGVCFDQLVIATPGTYLQDVVAEALVDRSFSEVERVWDPGDWPGAGTFQHCRNAAFARIAHQPACTTNRRVGRMNAVGHNDHANASSARSSGRSLRLGVVLRQQNRLIMNQNELITGLSQRPGVRVIPIEPLSFSDQVKEAATLDVLLGTVGAGLTHLVWMCPGTHAIEIEIPGATRERAWFAGLSLAAGVHHVKVMGLSAEPQGCLEGKNRGRAPCSLQEYGTTVNVTQIHEILDTLETG